MIPTGNYIKGFKQCSWTKDIDMISEPRWISILTCGNILGVHKITAYRWFYEGKLPGVRIGRTIRIDLRSLTEQLERQRVPAADGRRR